MRDEPLRLLVAQRAGDRDEPELVLRAVYPILIGAENGAEPERNRGLGRGVPLYGLHPGKLRLERLERRPRKGRDPNGELVRFVEKVLGLDRCLTREEAKRAIHSPEFVDDRLDLSKVQFPVFHGVSFLGFLPKNFPLPVG